MIHLEIENPRGNHASHRTSSQNCNVRITLKWIDNTRSIDFLNFNFANDSILRLDQGSINNDHQQHEITKKNLQISHVTSGTVLVVL